VTLIELLVFLVIAAGGYLCGRQFATWLGTAGWLIGVPLGVLIVYLPLLAFVRHGIRRHQAKNNITDSN